MEKVIQANCDTKTSYSILGVVVVYKPEKALLIKNISAIIADVDYLIIWKNSELGFSETEIISLCDKKIRIEGNQGNMGISYPLNFAWKYASKMGYNYLLTMDQDSVFENFHFYKKSIFQNLNNKKSIVGPLYNKKVSSNAAFEKLHTPFLITSGMVVPISVLDTVNGYITDFFVDCIDVEFCVRCFCYEIDVYQFTGACIKQKFGNSQRKVFCGKSITCTNYSRERLYNIFKNIIIIYRLYDHSPLVRNKIFEYLKNYFLFMLLVENNRFTKAKSILLGIYHGLRSNLSNYSRK